MVLLWWLSLIFENTGVKRVRLSAEAERKHVARVSRPRQRGLQKTKADYAYANQPAEYALS